MRVQSFMLASLLAVAVTLPTAADAQLRPWEISIAGGPSFPMGDLKDEAGTGYHVQGSVGFDLPLLPIGARADLFWQELPDSEEEWFRQIGGMVNAVFEIPMVIIQPYALVGVGYLRTETPEVTHTGHVHTGETDSSVGLNAGAGIEFPFLGLGGFLEARFINVAGGGEATSYQSVPVTLGVRF